MYCGSFLSAQQSKILLSQKSGDTLNLLEWVLVVFVRVPLFLVCFNLGYDIALGVSCCCGSFVFWLHRGPNGTVQATKDQ